MDNVILVDLAIYLAGDIEGDCSKTYVSHVECEEAHGFKGFKRLPITPLDSCNSKGPKDSKGMLQ